MRLLEVTVTVPAAEEEAAVVAVLALGVTGVAVQGVDTGHEGTAVSAWLPLSTDRPAVEAQLRGRVPHAGIAWREADAEWRGESDAVRIGRTFAIVRDGDAVPRGRTPIWMDPDVAFGDGRHPTTVLCVDALERAFARRRVRSVLDVGTGTGILAIVAARLGADRIVATDIDPLAMEAAAAHMQLNGVQVELVGEVPEETFDLVVANIYAGPLVAMAPLLAGRARETAILSGIVHASRPAVIAAWRAQGMRCAAVARRGAWSGLRFERGG